MKNPQPRSCLGSGVSRRARRVLTCFFSAVRTMIMSLSLTPMKRAWYSFDQRNGLAFHALGVVG